MVFNSLQKGDMSFSKFRDEKNATGIITSPIQNTAGARMEAMFGVGSKIVGTLTFEGPAEINGEVEGEIISRGQLLIGESAKVKAKIRGIDIKIRGQVEGDVVASKSLALLSPARVSGNIASATLSIEEGVVFEGGCVMKRITDKSPEKDTTGKAALQGGGA